MTLKVFFIPVTVPVVHLERIAMFILIITLFLGPTAPGSITTIEFTSNEACAAAAKAWAAQTQKTAPAIHFATVCTPK
jgi:hypothetical protein